MEWRKAKSILIVVFLILNIFLGYKIAVLGNKTFSVTDEDIRECRQILKSNNIVLKAEVPRKIKPLSNLQVYNSIYKDTKLRNKLFDSNMTQDYTGQYDIYTNNHMSTRVDKYNSSINNIDNYYSNGFNCLDTKENILKKVNLFFKDKGIDINNGRVERFARSSKYVKIEYKEFYNGFRIVNSYINLKISKIGVVDMDYKWYIPNEFKNNQEKLVSPADAIILVINHTSTRQKQIVKDISIAYYIEEKDKYIMDAEAIPVWQVVTNKKTYLINAYENSIVKVI